MMDKKHSDDSKPTSDARVNESDKYSGASSIENNENEENFEDDGEDLPENFFDDFSNQDFMEGLNVVDDWNDDDGDDPNEFNENLNEENAVKQGTNTKHIEEKPQQERTGAHCVSNPPRRQRKPRGPRNRNKYKDRLGPAHQITSEENLVKKSVSLDQSETFDNIDRRRDPEKTKRDIQRDKLRCAKDHKARVFQEQLKIAETGLVPPGTELDVVLNSEKYKHNKEAVKEEIIVKEIKIEEKKEKTVEKRKEDPTRHKPSPRRRRPFGRSVSRERSFSPKRRRRTTRSREREHRFRDISPEVDLRYRIREKRDRYPVEPSRRRMSRSPSPYVQSPASGISERESWLRSRERRHSRSLSPLNASRIRENSPKRKKFSFMEEIEIKLRQNQPVRDPNAFNIAPNPPQLMSISLSKPEYYPPQIPFQTNPQMYMGPSPSMCPPPEQFQQPLMMGLDPNRVAPMFIPNPGAMFPHGLSPFGVPQPVPAPPMFIDHSQTAPIPAPVVDAKAGSSLKQENQDLAKLFEDKKISLSDFLSVSAKPIGPSAPIDIHNKIKVISRCQEAIKMLEDPKLTGRFIPLISEQVIESEKRAAENTKCPNQSPLRKSVVVRFNFTVPVSKRWSNCKTIDQLSTRMTLHKLLSLLGMVEKPKFSSPLPSESSRQPDLQNPITVLVPPPAPFIQPKVKVSSVQTDPVICQICEIRNARKLLDGQTQTVETTTCEVSTQVSVEDLTKSCTTFTPRGILKGNTTPVKSISHLTPAQLLAQVHNEKKEDTNQPGMKRETFPAYGRSYADVPMSNQSADPFSDSYTGRDGAKSAVGSFGGKYVPFGGNGPNVGYNVGRTGPFGTSMNAPRAYNNFPNSGRPFQEQLPRPNSGSWNNPARENPRGFNNMQNNYYNQRGQN